MKTLLSATLAVLLVAAVTAQSSKPVENDFSYESLIEKVTHVINSLGGFQGTIDKLGYISGLIKKAYEDDGIGGWMARSLIKMELNRLKDQAMETEKELINNLLDKLETKVGLKSTTYSVVPAENYIFNDAIIKAIAFLRQSITEIVNEISQVQREHDESVGKISADVMDKLNGHIAALKEKLLSLKSKLFDKLTGRDQTAKLYGGNGGIRSQMLVQAPSNYNVIGGMIEVAKEQLKQRIFRYIEMIGEAKRQAQASFNKNKELVQGHLKVLQDRLKESMDNLKDVLRGKKSPEQIVSDLEEVEDAQTYAVQTMSLQSSAADQLIKTIMGQLRAKVLELVKQIAATVREAATAAGEHKKLVLEHLEQLKERLRKARRDLMDALSGKKPVDELKKDLQE